MQLQFTASESDATAFYCIRSSDATVIHCNSPHQMQLHLIILLPWCQNSLQDLGCSEFHFVTIWGVCCCSRPHNLTSILSQFTQLGARCDCSSRFFAISRSRDSIHFPRGFTSSFRCNHTLAWSSNSLRCNSLDCTALWLESYCKPHPV